MIWTTIIGILFAFALLLIYMMIGGIFCGVASSRDDTVDGEQAESFIKFWPAYIMMAIAHHLSKDSEKVNDSENSEK